MRQYDSEIRCGPRINKATADGLSRPVALTQVVLNHYKIDHVACLIYKLVACKIRREQKEKLIYQLQLQKFLRSIRVSKLQPTAPLINLFQREVASGKARMVPAVERRRETATATQPGVEELQLSAQSCQGTR